MHFGVQIRPTAESVDLRVLGRMVEEAGFESLFMPEHTHFPVVRRSEHPGGTDLIDVSRRSLDPFVALAVVAAATERLRVGTGVCLVPQHDPIVLAKVVATLDVVSGGRVIFGVGAGWNREEMMNHGTDPARRFAVMRERLLAMKRIWTEDEAAFHGELVSFEPIWQWPKPVQRPHPPILVGGEGAGVLGRVVEYGDGWIPNDHPEVAARMVELNRLAADRGRPPVPVTIFATPHDTATVAQHLAAGGARCVFNLPSRDAGETATVLERLAAIAARFA